MPSLIVSYPARAGARFDRDYYAGAHADLVRSIWEPHGLSGAEIFFPVEGEQPIAAMVVLRFPDQAAIDAALGDAGTPRVLADVANFTEIEPVIFRTQ